MKNVYGKNTAALLFKYKLGYKEENMPEIITSLHLDKDEIGKEL